MAICRGCKVLIFSLGPRGWGGNTVEKHVTNKTRLHQQPCTSRASRESWRGCRGGWELVMGDGGRGGEEGYGCYWRSWLHHVMWIERGEGGGSGEREREKEREGRRRGTAERKKAGKYRNKQEDSEAVREAMLPRPKGWGAPPAAELHQPADRVLEERRPGDVSMQPPLPPLPQRRQTFLWLRWITSTPALLCSEEAPAAHLPPPSMNVAADCKEQRALLTPRWASPWPLLVLLMCSCTPPRLLRLTRRPKQVMEQTSDQA